MSTRTAISAEIKKRLVFADLLRSISDFQEVDRNEKVTIDSAHGVKAYWATPDGSIDQSCATNDSTVVPRDVVGIHVTEPSDLLDCDPTDKAEIRRLSRKICVPAAEALNIEVLRRVVALADANCEGSTSTPVGAASRMAGLGLTPVTIGWGPAVEAVGRGHLSVGRLAADPAGAVSRFGFPPNTYWLFAKEALHVAQFGKYSAKEWDGHPEWVWHVEGAIHMGALLMQPAVRFSR